MRERERERGGYTSVLIDTQTVCLGVGLSACDSVSARVLCFSVCQFHFALYD